MGNSVDKYPRSKQNALDFIAKIPEFKQNLDLIDSYLHGLGSYDTHQLNNFLESMDLLKFSFDGAGCVHFIKVLSLWRSFSDKDVQNLIEDINNGDYDIYFTETNKNGATFNIRSVTGEQIQIGGFNNTITNSTTITADIIRNKLKENGAPENLIAVVDAEVAELSAEFDKNTPDKNKLQTVLSKIKEIGGKFLFDIATLTISQILASRIGV
ncbi:MAG: hypothetical protein LBT29_08060 [Flavobacteriaceae bacterium]|jgi:hypothetical protein|nr:hypothetical protein [Flavobacteriaceae bacterium]